VPVLLLYNFVNLLCFISPGQSINKHPEANGREKTVPEFD
jgi:hypothetical protein